MEYDHNSERGRKAEGKSQTMWETEARCAYGMYRAYSEDESLVKGQPQERGLLVVGWASHPWQVQ
jgi:hypothetical protein